MIKKESVTDREEALKRSEKERESEIDRERGREGGKEKPRLPEMDDEQSRWGKSRR